MLERNVGDQRMRSLRGVVLAWVPFANVDWVDLSSTEGSWQVALRALVTIPGYAQAAPSPGAKAGAGTTWMLPGIDPIHDVYPRGSSSTLSATYASEGTRESALAVSHAVQYHAHRRVELPAGATGGPHAGPVRRRDARPHRLAQAGGHGRHRARDRGRRHARGPDRDHPGRRLRSLRRGRPPHRRRVPRDDSRPDPPAPPAPR